MALDSAALNEVAQRCDALSRRMDAHVMLGCPKVPPSGFAEREIRRSDGFFDRKQPLKAPPKTKEQRLRETEKGLRAAISNALGKPPNPKCVSSAGCPSEVVARIKRFAKSEWANYFTCYPSDGSSGYIAILSWDNGDTATYLFSGGSRSDANFDESKHPRASNGEFGKGSGSSTANAEPRGSTSAASKGEKNLAASQLLREASRYSFNNESEGKKVLKAHGFKDRGDGLWEHPSGYIARVNKDEPYRMVGSRYHLFVKKRSETQFKTTSPSTY